MVILKLKKISLTTIKVTYSFTTYSFKECRYWESINKINLGGKNYKFFIDYLFNVCKVKPLYMMLSLTSTYVKSSDGETKWIHFLIDDDDLLKNL